MNHPKRSAAQMPGTGQPESRHAHDFSEHELICLQDVCELLGRDLQSMSRSTASALCELFYSTKNNHDRTDPRKMILRLKLGQAILSTTLRQEWEQLCTTPGLADEIRGVIHGCPGQWPSGGLMGVVAQIEAQAERGAKR